MIELRMTEDAQRRVVRANMTTLAVLVPLLLIAQVPLLLGRTNAVIPLSFLAFTLVLVAVSYPWVRHVVRSARVVLGDGTYTVRWMRTRRFTVADVERVVTIDQMSLGGPALTTPHLIVAGPTGRLVHLVGQIWGRDQLSAIALDLARRGVPLTPIHVPITPVQLRAYDRRLMPWWQAHRIAFALLVGAGALVVGVIAVVVTVIVLV